MRPKPATSLPVMLYHIPGRTGTPIATESLFQLAEQRIVITRGIERLIGFGNGCGWP